MKALPPAGAAGPRELRIIELDWPALGTCRLRLERQDIPFRPGQYLALGLIGDGRFREYTIASGRADPYFDILIRVVGPVSRALAGLRVGQSVLADGPMGFFAEDVEADPGRPRLCLASGTGVAAFIALARSYPGLDYFLVHGVRCATELYGWANFAPERRLACLSREPQAGSFAGRLTEWLPGAGPALGARWSGQAWPAAVECLLAGSSDMVHDAWAILEAAGVPARHIRTEIFF